MNSPNLWNLEISNSLKEAAHQCASVNTLNTELAIHALDQVHCWDAYFRLRIGHYENFTPLNF
jgi:hypothetical protein